ncbi:serine/threonine-protein kinase H1 homolog [Haemaphysalis longicornis]
MGHTLFGALFEMGCRLTKIEEGATVSTGSVQLVLRPPHQIQRRKRPVAEPASFRCCSSRVDARVVAKYAIKAVIAKGRFSRVLRVENRLSKQPYAIKVIEAKDDSHLETELSVLRRVRHPNVVRLDEVFRVGCRVYMVMELATGGNLKERLDMHAPFAEVDAARVIRMVTSGLAHLHSLGIAHRNLEPENLLYAHPGADAKVLIADFGAASAPLASPEACMHTACGSLCYAAPELLAGRPYTRAVDMWALGVVACLLLAGTLPFSADSDAALLQAILKTQFAATNQAWEHVSEEAKSAVHQLLQISPARRLSAGQLLQHPWLTATKAACPAEGIKSNWCRPSNGLSGFQLQPDHLNTAEKAPLTASQSEIEDKSQVTTSVAVQSGNLNGHCA